MKVRFREVKRTRKVTTKCNQCQKPLVRRVGAAHTVNPFNKNEAGVPKSFEEVCADVNRAVDEEANALAATGTICRNCENELAKDGAK